MTAPSRRRASPPGVRRSSGTVARSRPTHPDNLPAAATPLLGRDLDLAAARSRLLNEDVRLLTLTGAGGSGKTRLGLALAAEMSGHFPDGVFLITLAPISTPGWLPRRSLGPSGSRIGAIVRSWTP